MKKPRNLKKKALAIAASGLLATGLAVSAPQPARAQGAGAGGAVGEITAEAEAMIEAVSQISTGAFIATLGVLGGVLAIKYIKYNVFGS